MKALTVEKAQEIRAGKGHYHWICRDCDYSGRSAHAPKCVQRMGIAV